MRKGIRCSIPGSPFSVPGIVALALLPIAALLPAMRMLPAQQPATLQDADMLAADGAGRHVRRLPN